MKKFLELLAIGTLFAWGITFLVFYATGRIDQYLDPTFRIYALLSGIGMLLLGGFNFLNRNRAIGLCTHDHAHGEPCGHEHHHHHEHHDHDHAHCEHEHHDHSEHEHHDHDHSEEEHHHDHEMSSSGLAFSLLVLLIPLLVATGYSKDKFSTEYLMKWGKIERQMMQMRIAEKREKKEQIGSVDPAANPYTREGIEEGQPSTADAPPEPGTTAEAESKAGAADTPPEGDDTDDSWATFTIEDLKQMVPQNDAGEFLLDVPQIFYTAGDRELMEVMNGIAVETTAQLMEETLNNPNGQRLKAFRLFIECCAADARPLSIPVDFGKAPPEYTEMGWYRLYGKLQYLEEEGEILPILNIERIEEAAEPMDGLIF